MFTIISSVHDVTSPKTVSFVLRDVKTELTLPRNKRTYSRQETKGHTRDKKQRDILATYYFCSGQGVRLESGRYGVRIPLATGFFRVESYQKLALQWLPCQTPGDIGSALGLVGPVLVYCDWV